MKKTLIFLAIPALCLVSCLKSKTSWNGPVIVDFVSGNWAYYSDDALFGDTTVFHPSPFAFEELSFINTHGENGEFLGGCSVGHVRDTTFITRKEGETFNRFTVYDTTRTASNIQASYGRFGIYSMCEPAQEGDVFFAYSDVGTCAANSIYVANTTVNVARIVGLDGGTPFGEGDWIKLTITGINDSSAKSPVEVMLADFRGGKTEYVKGWLKVDISSIGDFDVMNFSVTSNRDDIFPDVCFNNLYVSVSVSY